MDGGCHGGQVHLAHHGLLVYCSVPGLFQSLYTGGAGRGPYNFETVGGIAMKGRSYRKDRYVR